MFVALFMHAYRNSASKWRMPEVVHGYGLHQLDVGLYRVTNSADINRTAEFRCLLAHRVEQSVYCSA